MPSDTCGGSCADMQKQVRLTYTSGAALILETGTGIENGPIHDTENNNLLTLARTPTTSSPTEQATCRVNFIRLQQRGSIRASRQIDLIRLT
jgi:hypothetical protein